MWSIPKITDVLNRQILCKYSVPKFLLAGYKITCLPHMKSTFKVFFKRCLREHDLLPLFLEAVRQTFFHSLCFAVLLRCTKEHKQQLNISFKFLFKINWSQRIYSHKSHHFPSTPVCDGLPGVCSPFWCWEENGSFFPSRKRGVGAHLWALK